MTSKHKGYAAKASLLIVGLVSLSLATLLPSFGSASAQSTLQTTKFNGEARLQRVRQKLLAGQSADVRPLTIRVENVWDNTTDKQAVAIAQRFILDLGGTPVDRDGQYVLKITFLGVSESDNGYLRVADYTAELRDVRSNGRDLVAQSALTVSCGGRRCSSPSSAEIKELFLRLGD